MRGLDWKDALLHEPVSHNQLIYTDSSSSARISLLTGTIIDVEENSLIRIQQDSNLETVDLEKGFLNTKLSGRPLRLRLGQKEVVLTSEDALIQISQDGDTGEIGVISGEVEMKDGKKTQKINPSQFVAIQGEEIKLKKISYELLSPKRGEKIYLKENLKKITFEWSPSEEGEVHLEDSSGKSIALKSQSANLGPGGYRWKVFSESGASLETPFSLISVKSPEILRPRSGEKVQLAPKENAPGNLTFQWEETGYPIKLEWTQGAGIESTETDGSSHTINLNSSQTIKWRLRIIYENSQIEEWSDWQIVDVELLEHPQVPEALSPDDVEFQYYKKNDWFVSFTWKSSWESELEIQSASGKTQTIASKMQELRFVPQESGEYKWRIRSRDDFGRLSSWSNWLKFNVKDLSNETITDAQRIQIERPNQEVEFIWEGEGIESVFEISKDPKFKVDVLLRKVEGSSASVNIPEPGVYFWRSRRYLSDGKIEVNEPRKVIIEPNAAPSKPKSLPVMEVPLEWKSVRSGILDFFISSAHADEVEGVVKINLPQHSNAKTYIVKILSLDGKTLLTRDLPSPEFRWERAMPGEYQWQYAIRDYWGRQSEFSDLSRLIIRPPEVKRALLTRPIRSEEVPHDNVDFEWSIPDGVAGFTFEVSENKDFSSILFQSELKAKINTTTLLAEIFPESGLYFWRILSRFPDGRVKPSSIGRFQLLKKEISPSSKEGDLFYLSFRRLLGILWTPSIETYSFKDNSKEGEIDGQNLLSTNLYALVFEKKYFYTGSVSLGRGKVFDGEDYSTAKLSLAGGYLLKLSSIEIGAGVGASYLRTNTYSIQGTEVKAKTINALQFGPTVTSLIPIDRSKLILISASYLLGEVKEVSASGDLLIPWKDFLLQGGLEFRGRTYNENSGEQTSFGLRLGVSKPF